MVAVVARTRTWFFGGVCGGSSEIRGSLHCATASVGMTGFLLLSKFLCVAVAAAAGSGLDYSDDGDG